MNKVINRHRVRVLLTAVGMLAFALSAGAAIPRPTLSYSGESVMRYGKWVRVSTDREGIYQITYDQLRAMGFNNPKEVKVYGLGGTALTGHSFKAALPDDMAPTAMLHTADGRVLFYADGLARAVVQGADGSASAPTAFKYNIAVRRNFYSRKSYYYLTDRTYAQGTSQPVPNDFEVDKDYEILTDHIHTELFEKDNINLGEGGALWHDHEVKPGDTETVTVDIKDYSDNATAPAGCVKFFYEVRNDKTLTFPLSCSENVTQVYKYDVQSVRGTMNSYILAPYAGHIIFKPAAVTATDADGNETVSYPDCQATFTARMSPASTATYVGYDRATVAYNRKNRIDGQPGGLVMNFMSGQYRQQFTVTNADPDVCVWNVTNPGMVKPHRMKYDTATRTTYVSFDKIYTSGDGVDGCRMVAFNPGDQHLTVDGFETVQNSNIHGAATPDMMIITTDELLPYAQQLADVHKQYDNTDVAVFTQQEVFNEFSGGIPHAMAYKRAAKMFWDRSVNSDKFKYLLLYGTSNWDNYSHAAADNAQGFERLLCYEVEPFNSKYDNSARAATGNFCSDDYFGMLRDDYDHSKLTETQTGIAVGRLQVRSLQDAELINGKLTDYIANPPSAENYLRVLLLSDDGDNNLHLNQSEAVAKVAQDRFPLIPIRAHNSVYPRAQKNNPQCRNLLFDALDQGVGYFNYTGHGNMTAFTGEAIYNVNYLKNHPHKVLPLAMLSTCDAYSLDRERNLGEQMVFTRHGGAIAVLAACRSVYANYNQLIERGMILGYTSQAPGATIGSVYRYARNYAIGSTTEHTVNRNSLCYNLLGDPAIRLPIPSRYAAITEIDGVDVTDVNTDDVVTVKTHQKFTIKGQATTPRGILEPSFNGTVMLSVYESEDSVPVIPIDRYDAAAKIPVNHHLMTKVSGIVTDGRFAVDVVVPLTYHNAGRFRIVAALIDGTDPRNVAICASDNLRVDPDNFADNDFAAPQITELYVNDDSFTNGQTVHGDINLVGTILLGEGGLNSSKTGIGASSRIVIDGSRTVASPNNFMTVNTDGTVSLDCPISDLADGSHTVTLSVADNLGTRTERTLSFVVSSQPQTATLTYACDGEQSGKVARNDVTFTLTHSYTSDPLSRLTVTDLSGNTVFTAQFAGTELTWRLIDNEGIAVPDGRYRAFVTSSANGEYAATDAVEVMVIRHTVAAN